MFVNEDIRADKVRVVSEDGQQLGVFRLREALEIAYDKDLDLVMLQQQSDPPVCKIMNYGKYRYQQSKKLQESKKKQKQIQVKEIKLRPMTSEHDTGYKRKQAESFIKEGNKVKVSVFFRGREMNYQQSGVEILEKFKTDMQIPCTVEKAPSLEGRQAVMILAPTTSKTDG